MNASVAEPKLGDGPGSIARRAVAERTSEPSGAARPSRVLPEPSSGQSRVSAHTGYDPWRGDRCSDSATQERRACRKLRSATARQPRCHDMTLTAIGWSVQHREPPRRHHSPYPAPSHASAHPRLSPSPNDRALPSRCDATSKAWLYLSRARTHPAETMCDDAVVVAFEATRPKRPGPPLRSGLAPRRGAPLRPGASVAAVGLARTPAGNGPAPDN